MSKHEYAAWWRFSLSGAVGVWLCWHLFFVEPSVIESGWENVRDAFNIFLLSTFFLDAYLRRRKGIAQDERDRAISGIAARDALVALGILVLATPIIISGGVVGKDEIVLKVDWFDFYVLACIALAIWVEAAVTVFHHWRDRTGDAGE